MPGVAELTFVLHTDAGTGPTVGSADGVSGLRAPVFDGWTCTTSHPRRRTDRCLDTADLRLARWGVTLRQRISGPDTGTWTLELPAGLGPRGLDPAWTDTAPTRGGLHRATHVEPAVPGTADAVPPRMIAAITGFVRGADLVEVARLVTTPTRWRWTVRGRVGAELVDDAVAATGSGPLAGVRAGCRELRLQTVPSAPSELVEAILAAVVASGAGPDDGRSTLARLSGDHVTAPADPATATGRGWSSAETHLAASLAESARRLVEHLPEAVLGTDPEGIHQARVAVRRLRSCLRAYAPLLEPPWSAGWADGLEWLSDGLGRVRDADVMLERLTTMAARMPAGAGGAARGRVLAALATERAEHHARLVSQLGGGRAARLFDEVVGSVAAPRWAGPDPREGQDGGSGGDGDDRDDRDDAGARERWAGDVLRRRLRRSWRRLDDALAALDDAHQGPPGGDRDGRPGGSPPDGADEERCVVMHRVRIRAKQLRYTAEAAAPVLPGVGPVAAAAADLQEILGELTDRDAARRWLWRVGPGLDAAAAFEAGRLAGILTASPTPSWRKAARQVRRRRIRRRLRR